ncbi:MAG: DsrE family protein [Pseudodonghicola sp.]|nr:DsrE family protein [Pseudodonghicola sp.]
MKHLLSAAALALGLTAVAGAALAEGQTHHIAFHVDQNDPKLMNITLNNVANVTSYYHDHGDTAVIEVVAYGPGLNMFVVGRSPVADRIATMHLEIEDLTFSACGNTLRNMSAKLDKEIELLDEAGVVLSGVVRLVELQEQGYAYIRP